MEQRAERPTSAIRRVKEKRMHVVKGGRVDRKKLCQLNTYVFSNKAFPHYFASIFLREASRTFMIFSLVNFGRFVKGQVTFFLSPIQ